MKISYNWLKQYINIDLPPADLAKLLTDTGLEVEGTEDFCAVKGGLDGVVVGEVVECERHPDADKLQVTKVDIGGNDLLQIVCGAPNCRKGLKVAVAKVGASLFPASGEKFEIKKAKIRGVESFGMLCAADELGLGNDHAGILELESTTANGTAAAEYFEIEKDVVFEIGLTPNRSDANSHIGVVRDIVAAMAVLHHKELQPCLPVTDIHFATNQPIVVDVVATTDCLRYSGAIIKNLKVAPSPQWLQNRLLAIGLRPINNVVDITNFVLHEFGQPLHAFDLSKINGNKIIVRKAADNTDFITLDNNTVKLNSTDLVIANETEAMCIAGVYGGADSGVTEATTAIFLESAYFAPVTIRKTATRLHLKTDASSHFEKGCDINATVPALERAIQLLQQIAGGEVASSLFDYYPNPNTGVVLEVAYHRINSLIGEIVPSATVKSILKLLGFAINSDNEDGVNITVPTYRTEVTREADVIEEILRIYGLNTVKIPNKINTSLSFSPAIDALAVENRAAQILAGKGFMEISTNSITRSVYETDELLIAKQVKLLNSQTADLDSLRTSMLYSGLEVIAHNSNRKNSDLRLFDFGKTYFHENGEYTQQKHLAIYLCGLFTEKDWLQAAQHTDFFHLKATVMQLLANFGIKKLQTATIENAPFDFALQLFDGKKEIAKIGKIAANVLKKMDIKQAVFFADINWDFVERLSVNHKISFEELNKFPAVSRDLALVMDEKIPYAQIEKTVKENISKSLQAMSLFDVYRGDKIAEGKKQYAVNFVLQDENKTLSDAEIDKIMQKVIQKLTEQQIELRK